MAISDILRSASQALREAGKSSQAEQLYSLIHEYETLQAEVGELKKKTADMIKDNSVLRQKLQEMLEQYGFQPGELEFHDGLLWITRDPLRRDRTRTAICQKCWQADRRLMRHVVEVDGKESGFECQACGAVNRSIKEKANRP